MYRSSEIIVKNALTTQRINLADVSQNSVADTIIRDAGFGIIYHLQINNNGAISVPIFRVRGMVEITKLYLEARNVIDSTTFSSVNFELDDGTVQTAINTAVDGSGISSGGVIMRQNTSGNPLVLLDTAAGLFSETSSEGYPFIVGQKTGAIDTYINLNYTGDANTDIQGSVYVRYKPLTDMSEINFA